MSSDPSANLENISKLKEQPLKSEIINDIKNKKEYALRPSYDDKCWRDIIKFRMPEEYL